MSFNGQLGMYICKYMSMYHFLMAFYMALPHIITFDGYGVSGQIIMMFTMGFDKYISINAFFIMQVNTILHYNLIDH